MGVGEQFALIQKNVQLGEEAYFGQAHAANKMMQANSLRMDQSGCGDHFRKRRERVAMEIGDHMRHVRRSMSAIGLGYGDHTESP